MTTEEPERQNFINPATGYFHSKTNIHGKRGKTVEIHVMDKTDPDRTRHLANVHMSFADNPRGTAVTVHGYNTSVFSPATNLSGIANESGLDYAFIEVVRHSILAKPEEENIQECAMRNLNEMRLGIARGLRHIRTDKDLCGTKRVLAMHSMGARAGADLVVSYECVREMFHEYIVSDGYLLTSPFIVVNKKAFGERFTERYDIKSSPVFDREIKFRSTIKDMILPFALPDEIDKQLGHPAVSRTESRKARYTENFIMALFDTHNFYAIVGNTPVNFVFAGSSEAIDHEDAQMIFKHFNGANKTMHIVPHALHNFTTCAKAERRDIAPLEYRKIISDLYANFAARTMG